MYGKTKLYIIVCLGIFFIPLFGAKKNVFNRGYQYFKNRSLGSYIQLYFQNSDIKQIFCFDTSNSMLGFVYLDENLLYYRSYQDLKGNDNVHSISYYYKSGQSIIGRSKIFNKNVDSSVSITFKDSTVMIIDDPDSYIYICPNNEIFKIEIEDYDSYQIIYEKDADGILKSYHFKDMSIVLYRNKHFLDWLIPDWEYYKIIVHKNEKIEYIFIEPQASWQYFLYSHHIIYDKESLNRIDNISINNYQEFAYNLLEDMLDNKQFDIDSLIAANSKYDSSINFRKIDDTLYCDNPEELWLYPKVVFSRDSIKPEELPFLND